MEWWNDLWLNEGFAKFMEFVSVDITYPELQVVRTLLHLLYTWHLLYTFSLPSPHLLYTHLLHTWHLLYTFSTISLLV